MTWSIRLYSRGDSSNLLSSFWIRLYENHGWLKKSSHSMRLSLSLFSSLLNKSKQSFEICLWSILVKSILFSIFCVLIFCTNCSILQARYGGCPVINSNKITPTDHKSDLDEYVSLFNNSLLLKLLLSKLHIFLSLLLFL